MATAATLNKYISANRIELSEDKLAALTAAVKGTDSDGCFDPVLHLDYAPPAKRYSMTEIGISPASTDNKHGVPAVIDFAYTEPFPLLSKAGVEAMRKAVLSEEVLKNCPFQIKDKDGAQYTHWQLRNTSKHSKFIKDFWSSPTVNAVVVDALQYEVVPTMEFEMGHVNLQAPVLDPVEKGTTGMHTDTNTQFVCIVMLSDAANMVGGETAFRKGDGSLALVKYPAAGYAIMMQGLNVMHSVTDVSSQAGERMTMVTSYQPRDHQAAQNGRIKALHCTATDEDRPQMIGEYAFWRMNVLSKRMADMAEKVEEDRRKGEFDLAAFKSKAAEFNEFLKVTLNEVDEE